MTSQLTFQQFFEQNREGEVNITPEVSYCIRDVIKRDIRLQNSKFEDPFFPDGDEKPFVNAIFVVARTLNQNSDFDIRNFNITANNTESIGIVGLFKASLKNFLGYSNYAKFLNDTGEDVVNDGHVIMKKCADGEQRKVNLLNVIRPAHVEDMSGGIAEEIHYNWSQLLAYKDDIKASDWAEILKLKESYESSGESKQYVVYEWWRWKEFNGKYTIVCEKHLAGAVTPTEPNATEQGVSNFIKLDEFETPYDEEVKKKAELKKLRKAGILGSSEVKKPIMPYVEGGLFRIPGRWKKMGVYELLATLQELYSKTWGQKVRHDEMSRTGVMVYKRSKQNKDTMLTDEWLNQIDTGGLFEIWNDEEVNELKMAQHTVDFISSLDKIFELIRLLSGVTSQRTGEDTPSTQTATSILRDEKVADTTFGFVKERKEIMYKELFEKFEFKSMIEDLTEEDAVALLGDRAELEKIEAPYIENEINAKVATVMQDPRVQQELFKEYGITNEFPQEEHDKIKQAIMLKRQEAGVRFADFKKEMFKNIDIIMEFFCYDETINQAEEMKQIQEAINTVIQMPQTNISADALVKKKLELMDKRFTDYEKTPEEQKKDMMMAQLAQNKQPQQPQQ